MKNETLTKKQILAVRKHIEISLLQTVKDALKDPSFEDNLLDQFPDIAILYSQLETTTVEELKKYESEYSLLEDVVEVVNR